MSWSWRGSGWIENAWNHSRRSARPHLNRFGSAWKNKHLPAMQVTHSAMVFTLSGLRREAGLNKARTYGMGSTTATVSFLQTSSNRRD